MVKRLHLAMQVPGSTYLRRHLKSLTFNEEVSSYLSSSGLKVISESMCGQVFQVEQTTLSNTSGAPWMVWKKVPTPKSLQLLCNNQMCKSYAILWATEDCLVNYNWYYCLFPCAKLSHAFPRLS